MGTNLVRLSQLESIDADLYQKVCGEGGKEGGREGGSERQASKRCASYTPIKELQYIHWEGGREG